MSETQYASLFGTRLRQARQMAGFSLRELSDRIGGAVSHNALAKYERGEMMPDGTLLIALSEALDKKPEFFFRKMQEPIQAVEYRNAHQLGEKEARTIRFKAQDHFERYLEIESLLGLKNAFANPLGKAVFSTSAGMEDAAQHVRKQWKIGQDPILNFTQTLESHGIKLFEVEAPDAFEGFSGWINAHPVIVLNFQKNTLRKRHTLSHELGHLLLKGHLGPSLQEDVVVRRFGAAFILPEKAFKDAFGGHRESLALEELIELKAVWGISISSIIMRAKELGLISQALYRRFWDDHGDAWAKARREPGDDRYAGREESKRFFSLVHRAIAQQEITRSKAAALLDINLDELREQINILS